MRCSPHLLPSLFVAALLSMPAQAQSPPSALNWQHDVESAKVIAKQSGRLVLVHFWTPECMPCLQLERNVFSQPGVAGAIESQFVPVKLDANQNSAFAQGLGIDRVPMDVILTPEGQVVGKLISPPTPSAYISEVGQVATRYATRHGSAFGNAVASAPQPPLINGAYANLPVNPGTLPASTTAPVAGASGALQSQVSASLPTVSGNAASPATPVTTPLAPGRTLGVPPAQPYVPQSPATDRFQTPFAQSQAIAPDNASVGATTSNANIAMASPGAIGVPAQVAPSVVPNQYAAAPSISAPPVPASPVSVPLVSAPPVPAIPVPSTSPVVPAPTQIAPAPAVAPDAASVAPAMGAAALQSPGAAPATPAAAPESVPSAEPLPIGFDGFCTVTMRNEWKWVEGNKQWGVNHRGRTYLFVGPKEQQQFMQNPDYYAPALSGIDVVLAVENRQTVPGLREHSIDYDNQIYLFASEATLQQFTANPERYAASVRQAMGIERGQLVR